MPAFSGRSGPVDVRRSEIGAGVHGMDQSFYWFKRDDA